MAFNIGDLPTLLSELTCSKCDKLLSVFPIYVSSVIGNVCGRCTKSIEQMITSSSVERNTAYESLTKHVLFPCSNREFGCTTSLKYDEVVEHEKCCIYRQQMCSFNIEGYGTVLQCNWKGAIADLRAHFNSSHTPRKTNNPHTFTLMKTPYLRVNYVEIELHTFVVITRRTAFHKFYCLVMCCAEEEVCKKYAYQMELGKGDDFFVNFSKPDTNVLLDTYDALEIVDNIITFDANAASNFFGNFDSDLNCKISITKKPQEIAEYKSMPKEQVADKAPTSSDGKTNIFHSNKLILEELECPVCNNYMRPPIYICTKGHSLCRECKIKVPKCPVCRVSSVNIRNFTLEKLTQKVLYPCQYSLNGCTEALSACVIGQHETTCKFKSNCPVFMFTNEQCSDVQEGLLNQINHIYEKHSRSVIIENFNYFKNVKATPESIHGVIVNNNEIFIVGCKNSLTTNSIKFNVLHLGMKENVPKYRYRLEFVDLTEFGLQLIVKQVCQPVPGCVDDAFQNCLSVPLDMVPYMTNDKVGFKLNIEKI